jgi:hypothetical protein
VAAGLELDLSAQSIARKIIQHGPLISGRIPLLTKAKQLFFRAPYPEKAL